MTVHEEYFHPLEGSEVVREGGDVTLFGYNISVHWCLQAAQVLSKQFGPRNRFAAITTDAPVRLTEFKDLGVDKVCNSCMRCVKACPTGALVPYKINWRGTLRWKIHERRCFKNYIENNACGICLNVCPWNKEYTWQHRAASEMIKWSGLFRKLLLAFDDHYYWKKSPLHPRNRKNIPASEPVSFKMLLETFGGEDWQKTEDMIKKRK